MYVSSTLYTQIRTIQWSDIYYIFFIFYNSYTYFNVLEGKGKGCTLNLGRYKFNSTGFPLGKLGDCDIQRCEYFRELWNWP